jgi:hypothetical protein
MERSILDLCGRSKRPMKGCFTTGFAGRLWQSLPRPRRCGRHLAAKKPEAANLATTAAPRFKRNDISDFVMELREQAVTPHSRRTKGGRRSAIDRRTTRHGGYPIPQRIRKRIEEPSAVPSR